VDPAVDETGTPYAFTAGDPVNQSDPSGLAYDPEDPASGPSAIPDSLDQADIDIATGQYEHGGAEALNEETDRELLLQEEEDCDGRYTENYRSANLSKFSNYIFGEQYADNGKAAMFESWGYTAEDSAKLTDLYEEQANRAFAEGDYSPGQESKYGEKIEITIEIPGEGESSGKTYSVTSVWMVEENGTGLRLITPYGGR
jgi:hypothetical protein